MRRLTGDWAFVLPLSLVAVAWLLAGYVTGDYGLNQPYTLAAVVSVIVGIALGLVLWFRRKDVVIPRKKVNAPSWWEQHGTALILTIVSAVASGLFAAVFLRVIGGTDSGE